MFKDVWKSIKIFFIFTFSILCLGCSSRFNIYVDVDVHFNKEGSGSYAMKVNFANIGGRLLFSAFNRNEKEAYEYMERIFKEVYNRVNEVYAKNKVAYQSDKEKQAITFSFNFKEMDELNDIIQLIYGRQIFSYAYRTDRKTKEKKFVLTNRVTSLEHFGIENFIKDDDTKIKWFSIRSMLSRVKICRTYHFVEKIKRINTDRIQVIEENKGAIIRDNLWKYADPKRPDEAIHYVIAFN